jgi:hypothetical protein
MVKEWSYLAGISGIFCWRGGRVLGALAMVSGMSMAEFDEIYSLRKDEVLRCVHPPFLPERLELYRRTRQSQAEAIPRGPEAMMWRWNAGDVLEPLAHARLTIWSMHFGSSETVPSLVEKLLDVYPQEIEGDVELLDRQLPGDFVCRPDAEEGLYLEALRKIVEGQIGATMNFAFRQVERSVIVLRGNWKFSPVDDVARERRSVEIYEGKLNSNRNRGGGGTGSEKDFAGWLGRYLGQQVVLEAKGLPIKLTWRYHDEERALAGRKDRLTELVLKHIEEQTGLVSAIETREVRRLFVERGGL